MYGTDNLKNRISITDSSVECPVKDCKTSVPRQRKRFQCSSEFMCQEHGIFISPSTFEYSDYLDNILWKNEEDLKLLSNIANVKRESRIARDNSEDAVTWNVFRFLEKENLLQSYLSSLSNTKVTNPEIIYWSYSQSLNGLWSELVKARNAFERNPDKGSEPNVIIKTDEVLFIIEAKLNATNKTIPSSNDPLIERKYVNGGQALYSDIVKSNFDTVAVKDKKYELLRFWLLGSWMAKNLKLKFYLVNLVLSTKETDIETKFKKHIKEDINRVFLRSTWEDIFNLIQKSNCQETKSISDYFRNKTIGYDQDGQIRKAFAIKVLPMKPQ